jgi:hypothetical protein
VYEKKEEKFLVNFRCFGKIVCVIFFILNHFMFNGFIASLGKQCHLNVMRSLYKGKSMQIKTQRERLHVVSTWMCKILFPAPLLVESSHSNVGCLCMNCCRAPLPLCYRKRRLLGGSTLRERPSNQRRLDYLLPAGTRQTLDKINK